MKSETDEAYSIGLWINELWEAGWEVGFRQDVDDGCWASAMKENGPCLFSDHKKNPYDALASLLQKVTAYEQKEKA